MLSQIIPSTVPSDEVAERTRGCASVHGGGVYASRGGDGGFNEPAGGLIIRSARAASHEPLRVQFHQSIGLEGSGFNPGTISGRDRPRWVRGPVRSSGAGRAGTGRRRQHASERDRCVPFDLVTLFGRAGSAVDGIVWNQRNPESRSGGTSDPHGYSKGACRDRGRGDVRGSRPEVPDMGAGALSCAFGDGAHESAGPETGARRPDAGTKNAGHPARSAGAMRGRGDGKTGTAGGPTPHVPVLLGEVCDALDAGRGGRFVDGTFGAGGYTSAILDTHPESHVIAIDRDPDAIAAGAPLVARSNGRLALVPGRFGELEAIVRERGLEAVDGVVLDIGVSSMQLDQAERGFSFRQDGPLDMRMERQGRSAADLVNEAPEAELADIFFHYGEERRARAVARGIIEKRRRGRIDTTGALAELVGG